MKTVIAIANQSLYDIANQEFGSISAAFHIAVLNNMAVTTLPFPGQVLLVPEMVFDRAVATYFKSHEIKIATVTKKVVPVITLDDYSLPGQFPYSF